MKQICQRAILLLLIINLCVLLAQAAETGELNPGVDSLGVTYTWDDGKVWTGKAASKTINSASQTIDVSVTSDASDVFGKYVAPFAQGTVTVTLTNNYEGQADLTFKWKFVNSNGILKIDGTQASNDGTFTTKRLKKGQSVSIEVKSSDTSDGVKKGIGVRIYDITLKEYVVDISTTFCIPEEGGHYSVDGTPITSEQTIPNKSNHVYTLTATPDNGYVFVGWRNEATQEYLSDEEESKLSFSENTTIRPVFISERFAQFGVGNKKFFDLNDANSYADSQNDKTIVLLKGGMLQAKDYTISAGVTLLVPYSKSTTIHTTSPNDVDNADSNRTAFRTLTVPAGARILVNGAINVDGQVTKNMSLPTGPYGLVTLESNAYIELNNGASLYCWGYVNGDGMVVAHNGAKVYECFQLTGWRGGTTTTKLMGAGQVFPINQFYIQNVETALKLEYGSTEYVYASAKLAVVGQKWVTEAFITSSNSGMFQMKNSGSSITKKYVAATDRVYFEVNGDLDIGTMTLDFGTLAKLKTEDYPLPLGCNFNININSGTTTISSKQDIALLPGAEFTVSEEATFVINSNMYVYDRDEWVGQNYAYKSGKCDLGPIGYTTTNGTAVIRKPEGLTDATVDVNGTMEINGKIFTTAGGANIFSTGGTGQIVFRTATTDKADTYQYNDSDTVTISCNSAWLRNGNGTYTQTAGAQAGWTYKYDTVAQKWYRFRVKYQFNGQDIGEDLITTSTSTWDVSFATGSLVAEIISGKGEKTTATVADGVLTVSDVVSDCVVNIKGVAASYTPYFVLNEKQYGIYLSYGGTAITNTTKIGEKTYYVVKACGTLEFGKALDAPENASMGVTANEANGITWFLEDTTTGAQVFMNTVPKGETQGGPVYIYGIYSGYVVQNTTSGKYYTNLADAVEELPTTPNGHATLKMLANCGTFEDESKTASYSFIANITFDLNGKEVWGSLVNNGTLTLNLNGGSVVYQTGATAPSSTYRASASIVNNGTLTIQDTAGGGKITIDAIEDNGSLQNYVSAVRNLGTLTMTGITAETSQTANDYSAVVLNYNGGEIETITDCHLIPTGGYGILNYGATITEISGGNIDGGSSSTPGRYGIQNRNLRTGTQQSGYSISKGAEIVTIKDVQIYVYQYGIYNFATIDTITGNTNIRTTSYYGINNSAGWYYDTQVMSSEEKISDNVKTTVYTYDTKSFPTIKKITGNTSVTSGDSYALWNAGNIDNISGDLNGTGVRFGRENDNGNYVLQNSGYIGEITGKVTISTNGSYVLSQNLWGTTNARCVSQTYIQKDVNRDGTYTSVGDVRDYTYKYIAPVIGTIGGKGSEGSEGSEITISGTSYVFYNFGTVTNISDGVKITASGSNALVNGTGGGYATWHTVRTNMGYDTVKNRYETRVEEVSERYQAQIGKIIGNVVIEAGSSAITNGGLIEEIGQGVTVKAKSGAIQNTSVTYTSIQRVFLGYDPTYVFGTRGEATNDYAFTADTAEIRKIDGATIQATAGNGAINNGGLIETITNSRISATGNYAVNNTSNVVTARKIYKDNTLAKEYALTEIFDKFFKEDSSGKYTSVAGRDAPNRIDTYAKVPTITEIGAGNTITAAKQAINNSGEITNIAGTEDSKTSVEAKSTAKDAMAIYNASALCGKVTVKDGVSVSGDYKTAAHIGKLENLNVSAAGHGIQNGTDNGSYLNVIDEIGTGVVVTSKNNNAVYNATKNAQIKSISGGIYTAGGSGYGLQNNNASAAIDISATTESGPYFKGGTSDRAHAISDPDNTARQTYPAGYTLSGVTRSVTVNDTAADGYYFVTKNEFTIVFDGNPATTVSGSVASMTVSRTATDVMLPDKGGFTREGFEQVGWALTADTGADSDKLLKPGATVTLAQLGNPTAGAEVKLYAVWKPTKTYKITVTWKGNLSYTYNPAVYRWDGATMKYLLDSPAYWSSTLGKDQWPSVTVTNAGTDNTKEGTVAVTIAYTSATNYDALNMDFTVNGTTTPGSATLPEKLTLGKSASVTMKLTGTPPNETANSKVVGSVKLTLTPTDG